MIAFVLGMIIGIVISIPVGPINVTVISKGFKQGFSNAFAVGLGASAMDFFYCAAAMLGLSAFVHKFTVNIIFQVIGFILLLYLGIRDVATKVESFRYENLVPKNGRFHSAFLVGVFMYVSNPTLVAFWITLSGIIQSQESIIGNIGDGILFALGVGSGTALWYYSLLKAIFWKRDSFKAETLTLLSKVSGIIMLVFSGYIGYELLAHFLKYGIS
ncbi:MAG TPA: LysE family transporter [Candidatus Acidoferrales bacterium]|nr:LysE family transporter [Candidatus Acidoferrales bacterium]